MIRSIHKRGLVYVRAIFEIFIPLDEDGFIEMECDYCKTRFMLHKVVYENEDNLFFFVLYVVFLIKLIHFCPRGFRKSSTDGCELYDR